MSGLHSCSACVRITGSSQLQTKVFTLQTRCPHCKTLYEIREAQLRAANGQARCSCCNNTFNAKKNLLQNPDEEKPAQQTAPLPDSSGAISLSALFDPTDIDESLFPAITASKGKGVDDDADSHPESKLKGWQISSVPTAKIPQDQEPQHTEEKSCFSASLISRELDDSSDEPSISRPAERAVPPPHQNGEIAERIGAESFGDPPRHRGRPLLWSMALLLLLGTALAQLVWFLHGDMQRYPDVRQLLELVCAKTGCQLPPWHEPELFVISSRSVKTHPQSNRALQIQLAFSNQARFAQPHPQLQLQLYDTNEQLKAQRVFSPAEYLGKPATELQLVQPSESVQIDMALIDPGTGVTGFKIEFL